MKYLENYKSKKKILVEKVSEFKEALEDMSECTYWDVRLLSDLKLKADYADGFELDICDDTYPCDECTFFTLEDRTGTRSKIMADYLSPIVRDRVKYTAAINRGVSFYGDTLVKTLIRGGNVLAVHTGKYNHNLDQEGIYSATFAALGARFPRFNLSSALIETERTEAKFSLCGHLDSFMTHYKDAWEKAGLSEATLENTKPSVSVITGDTGKETITIKPYLLVNGNELPLGESISMKHTGNVSPEDYENAFNKTFSAMQDKMVTVAEMANEEVLHPYSLMVSVLKECGMVKKAKGVAKAILDGFKDQFLIYEDITQFDIYYFICSEYSHSNEWQKLSAPTKLMVLETLNRLTQINMKKFDKVGQEDL